LNYNIKALPLDADGQINQTLGLMRKRAAEDAENPWFKQRALSLAGLGGSQADVARTLYGHVKAANIHFTRDEVTGTGIQGLDLGDDAVVETIIRPVDMALYIDQGKAIGDCDDFSMYLAALLKANGIPCAFATVAADSSVPDQFSHVYVVAYPDGQRLPLDASHGQYPGWETENTYGKYAEWPVWDRLVQLLSNVVVGAGAIGLGIWGFNWLKREFGI
jgi:hypothetical protein